jgi:hypothetical protein
MQQTETAVDAARGSYTLEGTLLEACSCGVLCPCWIGEDPDMGECFAFVAYGIDTGQINGVDVSALSLVNVVRIPGNILAGNWELVALLDERATAEQETVLLEAFTGKYGGPLADIAQLIGTVKGVERVPITHGIRDGTGTLAIPGVLEAEMTPFHDQDGRVTTLRDSVFSTVPGSPAYVGKASHHRVSLPQYGMTWEYADRNAIQSDWKLEHPA